MLEAAPGTVRAPARIVVRDLRKRFPDGTEALAGLDFEVAEHETLAVIGPSGCGKTTLLRALDGLLVPEAGEVVIGGRPVRGPRPDVAMVFQHFGLLPWKRLAENIGYGLKLRGRPRGEIAASVERLVALVGLEGFERHYPWQLSGGMQQRAGLARALAVDPAVLLMDEPFGSLDAQTRETLGEELGGILERARKTLVFVTHSVDEAIALGDRILLLSARPGRVREVLPVDLARPRDPAALRADPRAVALRQRIWDALRQEVSGPPARSPS